MNKVILLGRIAKDLEVKYTPQQLAVARFPLALDRGKDKEGNSRGADFPNIVCFGRTAENIERFSGKGKRIQVEGRIQTGSYEKDGHKVYTTDVIADRVEIIDWNDSNHGQVGHHGTIQEESPLDSFQAIDEDVPF